MVFKFNEKLNDNDKKGTAFVRSTMKNHVGFPG